MRHRTMIFIACVAFPLSAAAQEQTGAQVGAKTNSQTSVQADKTHAQASGKASASSSASAPSKQTNAGLASGTAFNAVLNAPVDSKKAKPGDPVTAHTTESVKSNGQTALPKGTKLIGHVTQASARAKGDSESALAITFDRALLKNGEEIPLHAAIQALASAQTATSASDADLDTMGRASANAGGSGTAGRGALTGVTSTAGSTVGTLTNTAATAGAGATGAVNATANSTTGAVGASQGAVGGMNAAGQLTSDSHGVFGMSSLSLNSAVTNNTQGSLITSAGKNVHLDSGARMLMVTQATASATPNP
jgi:hypothetical protein